MFAYCLNNPVRYADYSGYEVEQDFYDDSDPFDDVPIVRGASGGASQTVIYRYGGVSPSNLKPSNKDVNTNTGLSFSTVPKPGSAMTTIEQVNSTGVLYAVPDGKFHVSVFPIGGSIAEWRAAGAGSIWTTTLRSIVAVYK